MKLSVDIEKRVGDFALRVQFETEGVLGLLGASGSGKSMTLRCIAGLLTPDRGRITLGEQVLFDSAAGVDLPPQQRRVGYLFQQYALFPHMTVRQNIRCACRKRDRRAREAFIDDLLRRFDLVGLGERYPAQLSGGEQQRSALARIFAAEPKLLLLDEPTTALDQFLKWNVEREIGELLAQFAGPALWVTHDWAECRRSCDRICVMEAGKASAVTTAQQLLRVPSSVAAARIAGCRNFVAAQGTVDGLFLSEWEIVLPCRPPERCTVLAIPDGAIDFAGELLSCRVHRLLDDAAGIVAVLQPLRGKAPLYVTLPPSVRISAGEMLTIGFFAEKLLYY